MPPDLLRDYRLGTYVPPEVFREVQHRAKSERRSVSAWLRNLLIDHTAATANGEPGTPVSRPGTGEALTRRRPGKTTPRATISGNTTT